MEVINIITTIIIPILLGYAAYNERDKVMIKQEVRVQKELASKIESEVKVLKSQRVDLKEDLERIEKKVDKLLDKLIDHKL